jgi:hypothetical protein
LALRYYWGISSTNRNPNFSPEKKRKKKICEEGGLATTETVAYYFKTSG